MKMKIIDYKTGRQPIPPKHRNWQLGYYALAASQMGKVHKITLEMLRQDKPLEFVLDEAGNARAMHSTRMEFNIHDVEKEISETAKEIIESFKSGFKPCPIEKNCDFCNEYFYGRK
jgi:RecB family endonuclease NucS